MTESITITIWGREFLLPIVYDSLSDGIISENQIKAVDNWKMHLEWINKSKGVVEEYCKEAVSEDENNKKKNIIFSYIKPERLYVTRDKLHPKIAIMCKYKYDLEHGLAIVFDVDGKIEVGIQDLVL